MIDPEYLDELADMLEGIAGELRSVKSVADRGYTPTREPLPDAPPPVKVQPKGREALKTVFQLGPGIDTYGQKKVAVQYLRRNEGPIGFEKNGELFVCHTETQVDEVR